MPRTVSPLEIGEPRPGAGIRRAAVRPVQWAMEILVLALVALAPWPFGSVKPEHEFLLDAGIAVLAVLWGGRVLLEGRLTWRKCPVTVCLAALLLVGLWQMAPLPRGLLGTLSPATARLYDWLLPTEPEVLPGGAPRNAPIPPAGMTLSVYPTATRAELTRLVALVLLFVVVGTQ